MGEGVQREGAAAPFRIKRTLARYQKRRDSGKRVLAGAA